MLFATADTANLQTAVTVDGILFDQPIELDSFSVALPGLATPGAGPFSAASGQDFFFGITSSAFGAVTAFTVFKESGGEISGLLGAAFSAGTFDLATESTTSASYISNGVGDGSSINNFALTPPTDIAPWFFDNGSGSTFSLAFNDRGSATFATLTAVQAVPVPASMALLLGGVALLGGMRRRHKASRA